MSFSIEPAKLYTHNIDVDSIVEGMGYVALSRLRSLNGLKLSGINEMSFMVNKAVAESDEKLKQESEKFVEELKTAGAAEKSVKQKDFLNRLPGSGKIKEQKIPIKSGQRSFKR